MGAVLARFCFPERVLKNRPVFRKSFGSNPGNPQVPGLTLEEFVVSLQFDIVSRAHQEGGGGSIPRPL